MYKESNHQDSQRLLRMLKQEPLKSWKPDPKKRSFIEAWQNYYIMQVQCNLPKDDEKAKEQKILENMGEKFTFIDVINIL